MISNSQVKKTTYSILVVDDHPMVRKGIKFMLETKSDQYSFKINEAEDASDVQRKLSISAFDIILLDYELPGRHGPDLVRLIHTLQPSTKILCMSTFREIRNIKKMINAQVAGYITKDVGAGDLVSAIMEILAGRSYFSSVVANLLLNEPSRESEQIHPQPIELSVRESEVLKEISSGKTNKQIAQTLFIGERTVETYRKNLILKFGVKNTAELISSAYRLNLLQ